MNRTILTVAGVFSASSLLLVDSAVKGTALLVLAGIAAMILRRDSAATRHLVWLLAIVAMLVVPVLSAMLPQWRVLPGWAGVPPPPVFAEMRGPSIARPADGAFELPQNAEPVGNELPSATAYQPAAELPDSRPALVAPEMIPQSAIWNRNWVNALPLVWAIGFCVLILRLMAARWMLWSTERQGTVIGSSRAPAKATHDPIVTALEAVCLQLGIGRPVTLLIHPDKTIPVVWGIHRCHLLLPAAARLWTSEQLRSVLLHELAHIKRRDTMAQLLMQIACALHWFNPLVWFAAWRLGVERERACDDLVLASGVRPSAYAGHLLDVVTQLSPARWTQSCGLAMARTSSLEGRLTAVLSKNLNRRGVSMALAAIALGIGAGIAVPVAMLRAVEEAAGAATTAATDEDAAPQIQVPRAAIASPKDEQPAVKKPKHKSGQTLFKIWQENARTDGKIPGGALQSLADAVKNFIKLNPTNVHVPPLTEFLKRIDISHDWTPAEAVELLDDLTAIYATLPDWVEFGGGRSTGLPRGPIRPGAPLPAELEGAAWGQPVANGLRAAWVLEPGAEKYPLGTNLKARILFHNSGTKTVVFSTRDWHQYANHEARDGKGAAIPVSATEWTRLATLETIRLAPGEYAEAEAHGIGIGPHKRDEVQWEDLRVGAWIEAKAGDEVTFQPGAVTADHGQWTAPPQRKTPAEMWKAIVQARIDREAPLPAAAADREQLIRRVTQDLIGVPPAPDKIAAFAADDSPDPLAALAKRLVLRVTPFAGDLPTGAIKFRVTPADPDAAKKPRVATGPGRYTIGDHVRLVIAQEPDGKRRVNEASIWFYSPDQKAEPPGKPYEIKLPDGHLTWAIAWERGTTVLWVVQKGLVRSVDFTNPAQVKETRFEDGGIVNAPEQIREALKAALNVPGAPVQQQESLKPKDGSQLPPGMEERLKWGEPVNGLRAALVIRNSLDEPNAGDTPDLYLLVQNVSDAPIHLNDTTAAPNLRYLMIQRDDVPQSRTRIEVPTLTDAMLRPREATFLLMCPRGTTPSKGQLLAAGMLKESQMILVGQMNVEKAPAGAWTGTLVTGKTSGASAQFDQHEAPKASDVPAAPGGAKLDPGAEQNLKWGEPANGLRAAIVIRHSTAKPKAGAMPDLYVAVQNVSEAPIRLNDTLAEQQPRMLYIKIDGRTVAGIGAKDPRLGDVLLQSGEVAFVLMYAPEPLTDGNSTGSIIAEGVLKDTHQSLVAHLLIEKAPAGAWTGKLVTGETSGSVAAGQPQPKDKEAQALYKAWTTAARADGKIPGGVITLLGQSVKTFIKSNPTWETTPQLKKMVPRFDGSRDWNGPDVVALLDELAAVQDTPIRMALDLEVERTIRTGTPLPPELAAAPWGQALTNGLRLAWLLEPRAVEHRLGTPLKARILIHNAGRVDVVFRARTWHQGGHTARDAKGADIKVVSVTRLTRPPLVPFRLAPGEYIEVTAPGIGVGVVGNQEDWQNTNVGSWIEAKAGDEVTVTTGPVPLSDWNETPELLDGEPRWWLDFIAARLARHVPFPADAEARKLLLYRIAMELFGTPVSEEIKAAFVADREPTALDPLAKLLFHRPGLHAWAGPLTSGPTKFRVLPADPDAAKRPRTASNPGQYTLGGNASLVVVRRPAGERLVNEAHIAFSPPDATQPAPREPHKIKLPDGYDTWAAAWMRGGTMLWVQQKGGIRSYDFSNPAQVKETLLEEPAHLEKVPKPIRDALPAALDVPAAPQPAGETPKPAPAAAK